VRPRRQGHHRRRLADAANAGRLPRRPRRTLPLHGQRQPGQLERDIALHFARRGAPDFVESPTLAHGRIETQRIWCSTALNEYLNFPHLGQIFLIEREVVTKTTGKRRCEVVLGITSRLPQQASPQRLLALNRGHWRIESTHYVIDWNYDEDRSCIRTGHGPENITRLRRFALGVLNQRVPGARV